jgi:hypothetical protein
MKKPLVSKLRCAIYLNLLPTRLVTPTVSATAISPTPCSSWAGRNGG